MQPVPRTVRSRASWQRREHACQPSEGEGDAVFMGWKMLQILKVTQLLTICDEYAQPVELVERWL